MKPLRCGCDPGKTIPEPRLAELARQRSVEWHDRFKHTKAPGNGRCCPGHFFNRISSSVFCKRPATSSYWNDHASFWRDPSDGSQVMVYQPYNFDHETSAALASYAYAFGLTVTNKPLLGWYYPTRTHCLVWRKVDTAQPNWKEVENALDSVPERRDERLSGLPQKIVANGSCGVCGAVFYDHADNKGAPPTGIVSHFQERHPDLVGGA